MDCPKCKHSDYWKAGFANYKCKSCSYFYTVDRKSDVKTEQTRRLALEIYLEGVGFVVF